MSEVLSWLFSQWPPPPSPLLNKGSRPPCQNWGLKRNDKCWFDSGHYTQHCICKYEVMFNGYCTNDPQQSAMQVYDPNNTLPKLKKPDAWHIQLLFTCGTGTHSCPYTLIPLSNIPLSNIQWLHILLHFKSTWCTTKLRPKLQPISIARFQFHSTDIKTQRTDIKLDKTQLC